MKRIEDSDVILERLKKLGVKEESLKPFDYKIELKLYREMVRKEWKRLCYTTQA